MCSSIPKLLHFTARNKNEIHPVLMSCIDSWRIKNPEWDLIIYDDQDIECILKNHSERIYRAYKKISKSHGAARSDFFRYFILYEKGGAYSDLKSGCVRSLDEIAATIDDIFLSHWGNRTGAEYKGFQNDDYFKEHGELINWFIMAKKNHHALKFTLESVINNINNYNPFEHKDHKISVLHLTGPVAFSLAVKKQLGSSFFALKDFKSVDLVYNHIGSHHRPFIKTSYSELPAVWNIYAYPFLFFLMIKKIKQILRIRTRIIQLKKSY